MKLKPLLLSVFLSLFFSCIGCSMNDQLTLDLSGDWNVHLDTMSVSMPLNIENIPFAQKIHLPGTTDDAQLGTPNTLPVAMGKPQLLHLTRKNRFIGNAYYQREINIPAQWSGKVIQLNMERTLWKTKVWVDNIYVDVPDERSLTTPHQYNLTPYLTPGEKHVLTILVDNTKQCENSVNNLAHAYTDDTQIRWNGILGDFSLKAYEPIFVSNAKISPNIDSDLLQIDLEVNNTQTQAAKKSFELKIIPKNDPTRVILRKTLDIILSPGKNTIQTMLSMDNKLALWDEFHPNLYSMTVSLAADVQKTETFGLRKLACEGNVMTINGKPMFLRGTLECCIFPITGTPPMTKDGWKKVFNTAKAWGLNHLRFHSWCPPKAAFEVADSLGFYLQVELPVWSLEVGKDSVLTDFMYEEANRISRTFGNHPSFCLWSLGNELQSDFNVMTKMTDDIRKMDARHLYTTTSFTFEKGHGVRPESVDDFFITQWTNKGWVRGQGVFNKEKPCFDKDFQESLEGMSVPLITHEVGQYSVYPNISEIEKYTGVLIPLNFMAIKDNLKAKGLLGKASLYTKASGHLAAILYKEEVERALKTKGVSGFQLLDLHDFPGQGTALVGLLDAFWDSKGILSADQFKNFCAPVVPLIRYKKAVFGNDETFHASIELCNYGSEDLNGKKLVWKVTQEMNAIEEGCMLLKNISVGNSGTLGTIEVPLNSVKKALKLTVEVSIEGTSIRNYWNIWCYPANQQPAFGDVCYTRDYKQALEALRQGRKVLYNPDWRIIKGIEGVFIPVFWSPVHFPKQAGTMGVLCDPQHPAFCKFPTDMYTDWQWWNLVKNSTTMVIDSIQGASPIVEMVDNFVNNRRLSSVFEGKFGKGYFICSSIELENKVDISLENKQLLISLLEYMNSDKFNPHQEVDFTQLEDFLKCSKSEDGNSIY